MGLTNNTQENEGKGGVKLGELPLYEEESLRIAAPKLYGKMMETFSKYNLHPYDTEGSVLKKENGMDVTLKLAGSHSVVSTTYLSKKQIEQPDDEVERFFETSAEECKNLLIKNYFKMIKL